MSRVRGGRTRPKETGEGVRYQIADGAWLRSFLGDLVRDYGDGSEVRACTYIAATFDAQFSRQTLNRLRNENRGAKSQVRALSHQVAEALEGIALARGVHAQFAEAILSPDRRRIQQGYAAWCFERGWRFADRPPGGWRKEGDTVIPAPPRPFGASWSYTRQKRLKAIERALLQVDDALREFEQWLIEQRISRSRGAVAMTRIIEPLAEHEESAFVEPSWKELGAKELSAFIRAGITREKILLRAGRRDLPR